MQNLHTSYKSHKETITMERPYTLEFTPISKEHRLTMKQVRVLKSASHLLSCLNLAYTTFIRHTARFISILKYGILVVETPAHSHTTQETTCSHTECNTYSLAHTLCVYLHTHTQIHTHMRTQQGMYASVAAGIVARTVTSPFEVIKTVQQVNVAEISGNFIHTMDNIYKFEGTHPHCIPTLHTHRHASPLAPHTPHTILPLPLLGLKGLWRGNGTACLRLVAFTQVHMWTYTGLAGEQKSIIIIILIIALLLFFVRFHNLFQITLLLTPCVVC